MPCVRIKAFHLEFSTRAGFCYWMNTCRDAKSKTEVDLVTAAVRLYAAKPTCAFAVGDLIFITEHEGEDIFVRVKSVEYADPASDDGSRGTATTDICCHCPVSDVRHDPLDSLYLEFFTDEDCDRYEKTVREAGVDPIKAAVDAHAANGTCDFWLGCEIDVADHEGKPFTVKVKRLEHAHPLPDDHTRGDVVASTTIFYTRPSGRELDQRPKEMGVKSQVPSNSAPSGSSLPPSPPRGFPANTPSMK